MQVVVEHDDIAAKIDVLKLFLKSVEFQTLQLTDQRLLHTQLNAMETYENILNMRLGFL